MTRYIHRHTVYQEYGGPEEGGWWYHCGIHDPDYTPVPVHTEDDAYALCRFLNYCEKQRRKRENRYGYTSVLSYRDIFYEYTTTTSPEPYDFPEQRPHYE